MIHFDELKQSRVLLFENIYTKPGSVSSKSRHLFSVLQTNVCFFIPILRHSAKTPAVLTVFIFGKANTHTLLKQFYKIFFIMIPDSIRHLFCRNLRIFPQQTAGQRNPFFSDITVDRIACAFLETDGK